MSNDYHMRDVAEWEDLDGTMVPKDKYGHYLNWCQVSEDKKQARDLTSPYGVLHYAVGNSEGDERFDGDFATFFDFHDLPDGRIVLHAVVNTDSGGYIGDAAYLVVPKDTAHMVATDMVFNALEAVSLNEVEHDTEGWNQDPFYFARCVKSFVEKGFVDAVRIVKEETD